MIKWLAKFKYKIVHMDEILWVYTEGGIPYRRATVICKMDGFGKKKVECIGAATVYFHSHVYYHGVILPWLHNYTPKHREEKQCCPAEDCEMREDL